jgi:hypothetical protein
MSATGRHAHLSSAELLRLRDGLPGSLREARARSLRDLRTHTKSCLKCTEALLDLYHARSILGQRAATSGNVSDSSSVRAAPAGSGSPSAPATLRDVLQQRDVPPPSAGAVTDALPAPLDRRRFVFAALIVVVAAASAWYLNKDAPAPATTAGPAPVGGMTAAPGDATTPLMAQSLSLQMRYEALMAGGKVNAAQVAGLRARIDELDRRLAAADVTAEARTALWRERVALQQQVLDQLGAGAP